jgi:hypothetical protein
MNMLQEENAKITIKKTKLPFIKLVFKSNLNSDKKIMNFFACSL